MEKNNKVLVGLVIFLTICVIALGGFIIYDKVLDKKEPEVKEPEKDNNSTTTPTTQTPVKEDHSVILNGGWYQNDADVIKVNYKSVKDKKEPTTISWLNITYRKEYPSQGRIQELINIEGLSEEEAKKIYSDVYTINGKIRISESSIEDGEFSHHLLLTENYLIYYSIEMTGKGKIEVYDKNCSKVIEVLHGHGKDGSVDTSELTPVVHNKRIYYYGDGMEDENMKTGIKYIDLIQSKLVEKEVER